MDPEGATPSEVEAAIKRLYNDAMARRRAQNAIDHG